MEARCSTEPTCSKLDFFSWGIPEETARELTRHHTELGYSPGKLIFGQGSRPTSCCGVVKGVVRESARIRTAPKRWCGSRRPATFLGLADKLDNSGQWVRRFEAWTASQCVLAVVTREHVRGLMRTCPPRNC